VFFVGEWDEMEPSRDERNIAALAQSLGILVALPVWLRWRDRSTFVRAHAAQSIAFDGITLAAWVVVAALVVGLAAGGNAALSAAFGNTSGSSNGMAQLVLLMICAPGLALIGLLAVMVAALVLRLRATMAANQGKLFCYPLLNNKTFKVSQTSKV
jgi:uncharacterized Tic20 family protein